MIKGNRPSPKDEDPKVRLQKFDEQKKALLEEYMGLQDQAEELQDRIQKVIGEIEVCNVRIAAIHSVKQACKEEKQNTDQPHGWEVTVKRIIE